MDELDWACGTRGGWGREKGMHRKSSWISLKLWPVGRLGVKGGIREKVC
jgi:hypothetical protein